MDSEITRAEDEAFDAVQKRKEADQLRASLGRKFDADKPRWDLLMEGMPAALEEVVRVLTYGSAKYQDHNWKFVDRAEQRYLAAGMRHEVALQRGETHDPETGLHHLAHGACCVLFRLEKALAEQGGARG